MWPFSRSEGVRRNYSSLFFTNTLTRKKDIFAPYKADLVTLYSCGPTVYSPQHIGNMRAAVFADLVARVLKAAEYRVRRVINITDVGHLLGDNEGDADQGEDRIEKSARESGVSARDIAERYTARYLEDIRSLNLDTEDILFPRATEYIKEQIAFIQVLEEKGYTYRTKDGIYYDIKKFPEYGKLGNIPQEYIKDGSRASLEERIALVNRARIKENPEKRNPADFALWKFSSPDEERQQEWESPWGRGFPGWHIECSAMAKALLGDTIDVHTGGIEHIPVHHNNEIAQSEAANERPFARYWIHQPHLTQGGEKFSKSTGNIVLLSDIVERGIHPLALRYFFLQAHYRKSLAFSWEALEAANEALHRLWRHAAELKHESRGVAVASEAADRITTILRDDLATPAALALLWDTVRDEDVPAREAWGAILAADAVLGLSLENPPEEALPTLLEELPEDVHALVREREKARSGRDFAKADELRVHIQERGYGVEDTENGPLLTKTR